jgi:predicted transcriptional regulator
MNATTPKIRPSDPGPLTDADRAALAAIETLDERFTCTELGEALWGAGGRQRQSYARPAGKAIKRLVLAGLVAATTRPFDEGRMKSCYTRTGKPAPEPEV